MDKCHNGIISGVNQKAGHLWNGSFRYILYTCMAESWLTFVVCGKCLIILFLLFFSPCENVSVC